MAMRNKNCLILWSGGKDSFWAYHQAKRSGYNVCGLLTFYLAANQKTVYHDLKMDILKAQAGCFGVPIYFVPMRKWWIPNPGTWRFLNLFSFFLDPLVRAIAFLAKKPLSVWIDILYGNERIYQRVFTDLRRQYDLSYVVTSDLPKKEYDVMSHSCNLSGLELLSFFKTKEDREKAVTGQIDSQVKFLIVSADPCYVDKKFVGKVIDHTFLNYLRANHVDICGANGEFHTFVVDAPGFNKQIEIFDYDVVNRRGQNILNIKGYRLSPSEWSKKIR